MINHPNRSKTKSSGLVAYLGKPELKTFLLNQLVLHREADKLVKGHYWENGKGCAVGCTLEAVRHYNGNAGKSISHGDHALYERELGIPQILARLEDRIFEGLPNGHSQAWPERFTDAIRPGADLSGVWPKFAAWLLADEQHGVIRFAKTDEQRAIIKKIADLYLKGETDRAVWRGVWDEARRIRTAADAAAYAADADAAARDKHFIAESDKLIDLLKAA